MTTVSLTVRLVDKLSAAAQRVAHSMRGIARTTDGLRQAARPAADASASLGRALDGVGRAAGNAVGGVGRAARSMDGLRASAGAVQARLLPVGRSLAGALGMYGLGRSVAAGVTGLATFERGMTRIGITAEATKEEIAGTTVAVRKLAHELALPADDVRAGLDTLVAQGRKLPEAMGFLPTVARTAQATGAALTDIAKTADAVATHFGVAGERMQAALDIAAAGGGAGQFELPAMARYLPSLIPAAKALGFKGEKGVADLIAKLQIIRKSSGTDEEAAASMADIFQKIQSEETVKNFKKMGVDLPAALKKGKKEGRNLVEVLEEATLLATKGDLSKIPQLFPDREASRGLRATLSMKGAWQKLSTEMQRDAPGWVMRNITRVTGDAQAAIVNLTGSWNHFWESVAKIGTSAGLATWFDTMARGAERVSNALDRTFGDQPKTEKKARSATEIEREIVSVEHKMRKREHELKDIAGKPAGSFPGRFQSAAKAAAERAAAGADEELRRLRAQFDELRQERDAARGKPAAAQKPAETEEDRRSRQRRQLDEMKGLLPLIPDNRGRAVGKQSDAGTAAPRGNVTTITNHNTFNLSGSDPEKAARAIVNALDRQRQAALWDASLT